MEPQERPQAPAELWIRLLRLWAATAAACAVVSFPTSSVFSLRQVEVRGALTLDPQALVRAAGLELGSPLASVDPERVRRELLRLPRVRQARVEVQWPSRVVVWVQERKPLAVLRLPDRTQAAVDGEAVVLDRGGQEEGLPVILIPAVPWLRPGEVVPAAPVVGLVAELAALPEAERRRVRWVRWLATGDYAVGGWDGVVARVAAGQLQQGLRRAQRVREALRARGVRPAVVDVRFRERAVVEPAP